jgi:hypothetical protein
MIDRVMEAVSFLFFAIMRTPGGVGMTVVAALLLILRWMIRDRNDSFGAAMHH